MIVRVRSSPSPSEGAPLVPMVDVATQDGKVSFRLPLTFALRARLNGRDAAYFRMSVDGEVVEIGDEVEGETW